MSLVDLLHLERDAAELHRIAPICARCGHRVSRISVARTYRGDALAFRVECHGAAEDYALPYEALADAGGWENVQPGRAFVTAPALESPR